MEGVLTAIVAFIFVCIVFPKLVRVRAQFYAAVVAVVVIIFFHSLATMIGNAKFWTFVGALNGLLMLGAFVMMILATGGLSLHELSSDIRGAFEVIRRGEDDREILIPRGGQGRGESPPAAPVMKEVGGDEPARQVYTINSAEPSAAGATPPPEPPHAPFPPPTPSDDQAAAGLAPVQTQSQGKVEDRGGGGGDRSAIPLE